MNKNLLLLVAVCPVLLSGCAGALVGAGASVGIAAAQEGGLKRAWTDTQIQAKINELWFEKDIEMFRKLDMTVNQGRVLITGIVQSSEMRVEAVRLAWQAPGVKQVINEIRVAKGTGVTGFARDTWITSRLRTAITFNRDIQSINYSIDTVQGTVYLMGVAQNQQELNRVVEIARTIPDVKQVVSYVKFVGRPIENTATGSTQGNYLQGTQEMTSPSSSSSKVVLTPPPGMNPQQPAPYSDQYNQPRSVATPDYSSDMSSGPVELVPQPVQSEQLN